MKPHRDTRAADDDDRARVTDAAGGTPTPMSRREMLMTAGAGIAAGAWLLPKQAKAADAPSVAPSPSAPARAAHMVRDWQHPGLPNRDYLPVVVPNGTKLPWKIVDGVKVFHMVAEEVEHELAPGLKAQCWGYNGSVHGPVIEMVERDRVRIYVTNRLPAPTTVHWHAILLLNGMDGVGGLTQKTIAPGETFKYEFTVRQHGTAMYHPHHDEMTQMALGMTGMIVIHPRAPVARVDRDFVMLLHEWRIKPGARRPDPNEMVEFNMLTINGRAFPGTDPLVAKTGERVRMRFGNLSAMDHHPIHLHGFQFLITETDGGQIPKSAQQPETTVLVPVGSTRTIEFVANEPGDWAMHCHMTHHIMNQMGHGFPNMIGVNTKGLDDTAGALLPGYMTMGETGMDMGGMKMPVPPNSIPMQSTQLKHDRTSMGGMFTILKVRDRLQSYADPGWYDAPAGTTASAASTDDLWRDGIDVKNPPKADASQAVRMG